MKDLLIKIGVLLSIFIGAASIGGCDDDESWDNLPTPISNFISQYFPGVGVSDYDVTDDTYHVKIKNGPGMTFDKTYKWISINGYGEHLPQVLMFDQLPPAMYEYIQGNGLLDGVMSMERNSRRYTLVALDTTVYYDIETGRITEGEPS